MNIEPRIVKETVKGCILVLRYFNAHKGGVCTVQDLMESCEGLSLEAQDWVLECIKDGITTYLIDYVVEQGPGEDYKVIWDTTNKYLSRFVGFEHHPIEKIDFLDLQ